MIRAQKRYLAKLVVSMAACLVSGAIGSVVISNSIDTLYLTFNKPQFALPDSVFGPKRIILYMPMGIAAFLVWRKGLERREVRTALVIFSVQLVFSVLWSVTFFGLRSLHYGMLVIMTLWLIMLLSLIMFFRISIEPGLFILPYFLWVSFVAILNVAIWAL